MSLHTYPLNRIDNDLRFYFVSMNSEGENRVIKIVAYEQVTKYNITYYNLGFGDLNPDTGEVDDEAESNNGDVRKILSTVVSTLPYFF